MRQDSRTVFPVTHVFHARKELKVLCMHVSDTHPSRKRQMEAVIGLMSVYRHGQMVVVAFSSEGGLGVFSPCLGIWGAARLSRGGWFMSHWGGRRGPTIRREREGMNSFWPCCPLLVAQVTLATLEVVYAKVLRIVTDRRGQPTKKSGRHRVRKVNRADDLRRSSGLCSAGLVPRPWLSRSAYDVLVPTSGRLRWPSIHTKYLAVIIREHSKHSRKSTL